MISKAKQLTISMRSTRSYRGVQLAQVFTADRPHAWYRIKVADEIALVPARMLPDEWLRVYVRWHRARGRNFEAVLLLRQWLDGLEENGRLEHLERQA